MYINWALREVDIKIVYYGPPLSGKTTNLEQIHSRMVKSRQNELVTLQTQGDRTLYFDFLPITMGKIGGVQPRFNLYTVPGQSMYKDTRRLILEGVDGIIFVADSQITRLADNERAFREMKRHLQGFGYSWFEMPIVLQYNKQDMLNRVSEIILQQRLNPDNALPYFNSTATKGIGVLEPLKKIIALTIKSLKADFVR